MMLDSALSTLFGGGGTKGGGVFGSIFTSIFSGIGKNADGTEFWRGGATVVGERGPEIIKAPRGSRIIPNHQIGAGAQKPATKNQNDGGMLQVVIQGASGDDHVRMLAQQGTEQALAAQREADRRGGSGAMYNRWQIQKG